MVKLNVVRIVEEEWEPHTRFLWSDTEIAAFEAISVTSTEVDENLQRAQVYFFFNADTERHECSADICTHESVWSCDFDFSDLPEEDEDKGIPSPCERFGVNQDELDNALLNFGEKILGMYS